MRVVAYIACVRLLAETIAALPCSVYAREERGRSLVADDPRFDLVHVAPNDELTAYEFWAYVATCLFVYGNSYVWLETNPRGEITALWPIHPSKIRRAVASDGVTPIWAVLNDNGSSGALMADEVMHFKGIGLNSGQGMSPVAQARQALGISMSAEDYAGRIFQNDSTPGGIITTQKALTEEQFAEFMKNWRAGHQGLRNSHKIGLLPPGFDYQQNQFDPQNSQMMEARRFQVEEIARLMRIPPHMIGHPVTSSYNSLEQQSLEFVTYTLAPILRNLSQRVTKSMFRFPADLPRKLFVEFDPSILLRTDAQSQSILDKSDRMYGIKTSNEIREARGLPPVEGGDDLWMPTNMSSVLPDGTLAGVKVPSTLSTEPHVPPDGPDPAGEPSSY